MRILLARKKASHAVNKVGVYEAWEILRNILLFHFLLPFQTLIRSLRDVFYHMFVLPLIPGENRFDVLLINNIPQRQEVILLWSHVRFSPDFQHLFPKY